MRRANLSVTATRVSRDDCEVFIVRPTFLSLDRRRFRFDAGDDGHRVSVTEFFIHGVEVEWGQKWEMRAFPSDENGRDSSLGRGEELATTVMFRVQPSSAAVAGWIVALQVASRGLLGRHKSHWMYRTVILREASV